MLKEEKGPLFLLELLEKIRLGLEDSGLLTGAPVIIVVTLGQEEGGATVLSHSLAQIPADSVSLTRSVTAVIGSVLV